MSESKLPSAWSELLSWLIALFFLSFGLGSLFLGGFLSFNELTWGEPVLKTDDPIFWVLITGMFISGGLGIFYASFFKPSLLTTESIFLHPDFFYIGGATYLFIAIYELIIGAGLSAAFWVAMILGAIFLSFGYWVGSKEKAEKEMKYN